MKTVGSAVQTEGAITVTTSPRPILAMGAGKSGNVQITSPVKTDTTYTVEIEAQDPAATGEFTLILEFDVAETLTIGTDKEGTLTWVSGSGRVALETTMVNTTEVRPAMAERENGLTRSRSSSASGSHFSSAMGLSCPEPCRVTTWPKSCEARPHR